jgi:hypothetical protein
MKPLQYSDYSHIVSRVCSVENGCAKVLRGHTKNHRNADARRRETTDEIAHVCGLFCAVVIPNQPQCAIQYRRAEPQVHAQHAGIATINIEGIMTRRTIEQRLAQLEAQKKTLQARLGKQDRARDTRRKVLLGALVLHRLQTEMPDASTAWLRAWLSSELPVFLTHDTDKSLLADVMAGDARPTATASQDITADTLIPKRALEPA